jgi:hypothetical protein
MGELTSAAEFRNRLAELAARAAGMSSEPDWLAAVEAMRAGAEVPPADILAPAWLPGASVEIMDGVARDAVRYVRASLAMRAAQAELAALLPYYPRQVAAMQAAGYREDTVHRAWARCERQRTAIMRHRRDRASRTG